MKIAVYTIAKNEVNFVQRWAESAKDADYLLIADTGSTDGTLELADKLGIHTISITINPWRFDDARNASLAALPVDIDYCIALDMDEVLQPRWRQELERLSPRQIHRPRYQYTWSWNQDGTPGLVYGGDKIHARKGYRWKHPVHEVLTKFDGEEQQQWTSLEIHHHPDHSKSRGQYFPLLEMAVREAPQDDRNAFYYARELFFHDHREKAIEEFKRHLALPSATWKPERAASMRYLAKLHQGNPSEQEQWLQRAVLEAPGHREARVDLAQFYHNQGQWDAGFFYAKSALKIKDRPLEYLCESDAWEWLPYDLAAVCAYRLGLYGEAFAYGQKAVEFAPHIERLQTNLKFYKGAIDERDETKSG